MNLQTRLAPRINAWTDPTIHPSHIASRCHNILIRNQDLGDVDLDILLDLFAMPEPAGQGLYNHHDGYRT